MKRKEADGALGRDVVPLFVEAVIVSWLKRVKNSPCRGARGHPCPLRARGRTTRAGRGRTGRGRRARKEPPAASGSGGARLPPGTRPRAVCEGGFRSGAAVTRALMSLPRCGGGRGVHTPPCSRGRLLRLPLPRDGPSVARGHAGATRETPSRTPGTDQHTPPASFCPKQERTGGRTGELT